MFFTRNLSVHKSERLYLKWMKYGCRPCWKVQSFKQQPRTEGTNAVQNAAYSPCNRLQFEFHSITTKRKTISCHTFSRLLFDSTRFARKYISYGSHSGYSAVLQIGRSLVRSQLVSLEFLT